tara:strand:- start:495 stop:659 length:165 start_codon:yes stop_codon:yes gene_type:complete
MTVCSCPKDEAQPSGSAQHQSGFFELGEHGQQQTSVKIGTLLLPAKRKDKGRGK